MKTNILFLLAVVVMTIFVSSCDNTSSREVTLKENNKRIDKNYPYLSELNGVSIIDSAFNRVYTVTDCSDIYIRTYKPEWCGVTIEIEEWSSKAAERISFNDNLYDGSLDEISIYDNKEISLDWNLFPYSKYSKLQADKDNFSALLKDNQVKFDCLRKRISELANIEINKIHKAEAIEEARRMQKLQDKITTLVSCE